MPTLNQGDPIPVSMLNAWPRENEEEETLVESQIPLSSCRYSDGDPVNATGAAGDPKIVSGGYGSGTLTINGADACGNTKTETLLFEWTAPESYMDGGDIKVVLFAYCAVTGAATISVKTIDVEAYRDAEGVLSADLCATTIQTLGASSSTGNEFTFTITGTSMAKGNVLRVFVQTVITETGGGGGTAGTAIIQAIEVKSDRQG